jgi:hypothetical protein
MQMAQGKPVSGGLMSLFNGKKPQQSGAQQGNGIGTYWDPFSGTFVGGGQ